MTNQFIPKEFLNSQHLPLQDLKQPSFCSSSKAAKIETWVSNLQATKIAHTSIVLYQSIPELNRLKSDFENRLKTLDCVRPTIQNCIQGLTRDFLHQPLILPEEAQKFAIICQALQKAMVDGYVLCLRDICNLSRFKPDTINTLSIVLHRAISGIGAFFFRTYQLYTQAPPGMWRLLHGLYQVAEYYDLLDRSVLDPSLNKSSTTTIRAAWLRVIMLSAARTNQLNQNDIAHTYSAFAQWASVVKISSGVTSDKDNFYIVNLSQDAPPCYKSRFNGAESDRIIELDFKALVGMLSKQSGKSDDVLANASSISISKEFPDSLLDHLLNTWGNVTQRKLGRRDVSFQAEICVGLVDCHYFLAGKRKFEDFVSGGINNDEWDLGAPSSFTPRSASEPNKENAEKPTWQITIQNVSAGGYCVLWQGEIPPRVEAGEVVCLKERNRPSWNLGVVRWIKQLKQASQLGIQLLSSHPSVCGIAQVYDMGGYSDYMRALLLPAAKHNNVAASILTLRAPFGEMHKARLLSNNTTTTVRLDRCIFSTGSIKQFAYRQLEASGTNTQEDKHHNIPPPPDDFDSSWDDS